MAGANPDGTVKSDAEYPPKKRKRGILGWFALVWKAKWLIIYLAMFGGLWWVITHIPGREGEWYAPLIIALFLTVLIVFLHGWIVNQGNLDHKPDRRRMTNLMRAGMAADGRHNEVT